MALAAFLALGLLADLQDDDKKAREEVSKKALEDFKAALKDAKTLVDKARAILALGDADYRDGSMVSAIARFLAPAGGDVNYVLPVTAVETLSKFRGSPQAAGALTAALASFRKVPYVYARIFVALGKVGHESALPTLEEPLKGLDPAAAALAVQAISEMPPSTALDVYFREYERIEKKKGGASDDLKKVFDRVQPELLKGIQKISGEKYPTLKEFQIWWDKRGPKLREEWAAKEKVRASGKRDPAEAKGVLPPALLVELCFNENGGTSTANTGASSSLAPAATFSKGGKPLWTAHAAPNGGGAAVDFTRGAGPWGVDLGGGAGLENLRNLKSFTICGWAVLRGEPEGPSDKIAGAGNRIVSWYQAGQEGVELVFRTDGSLQLGVNQWADAGAARSAPKQFPLLDEASANIWGAVYGSLRYFAATYDSTASQGHAKFYVGSRQADAKLVSTLDYPRGAAGAKIAPALSVGNVGPALRPHAPDRSFRGFLDEIRVYGSAFDGTGALTAEQLIQVQNRVVVEQP